MQFQIVHSGIMHILELGMHNLRMDNPKVYYFLCTLDSPIWDYSQMPKENLGTYLKQLRRRATNSEPMEGQRRLSDRGSMECNLGIYEYKEV